MYNDTIISYKSVNEHEERRDLRSTFLKRSLTSIAQYDNVQLNHFIEDNNTH